MAKPTLRGLLLGSLLAAGLSLAIVAAAVEHMQYRRVLERKEARYARSLAAGAATGSLRITDERELFHLVWALAREDGARAIALLGDDPLRVLLGSRGAWTGRPVLEIAELAGSGALAEALGAPRDGHIYDSLLDRFVYIYPAGSSGREILGEMPSFVLVQLDASALRQELWIRTIRFAFFAVGLLGVLGMLMLRVVQRYALEPLSDIEGAVQRQTIGEAETPMPVEFATRELTSFGRMLAEMIRKRNMAHSELQRSEAELRLLGQVTRIADRAGDLDQALRECCAQVCRFLCWPMGHVYLVDENDPALLHPTGIWHVSSPELARQFIETTASLDLREGEDLPGRVLEYKEPVWIRDCWEEDGFKRSPSGSGLVRAAVGFPIFVARDVVAVLELFDLKPREREGARVELMHNIGLTLGRVVQRRQHQELLMRRNQELVQAMQDAVSATHAKSSFLANMSHEIRTPLTAIVGYSELLREAKTEEERTEHIVTIQRNGDLLLQLVNDILDVSKIEAGRLEVEHIECFPAEILQAVVGLVEPRAREKEVEFRVRYDGLVPERIISDPIRVQQVLLNLLGNAVKFTEQGYVQLTAGLVTPPDAEHPRLRFTVEDTGIGMPPQHLEDMFSPFAQADTSTTRRFGGTGLGLSIASSLIELLGGTLTAESEEGRGSRFCVTLETGPLEGVGMLDRPGPPAPRLDRDQPKTVAAPLEGVRILLAEDGPDNQRLITKILSAAGAKVELVENGALAVESALAAASAGGPFEVIFMDMQMPVMDGYAAVRNLRQQGYRGRIVAITANAMKGDREKCLEAGCDEFLSKPVTRVSLISAVAEDEDRD